MEIKTNIMHRRLIETTQDKITRPWRNFCAFASNLGLIIASGFPSNSMKRFRLIKEDFCNLFEHIEIGIFVRQYLDLTITC